MKNNKKIFCMSILFLLVVGFSSLVFAEDCTDSDGGANFMVKGTTTGIRDEIKGDIETVTDFCIDDNNLQEYYCDSPRGQQIVVGTGNKCPYGCKDGACIGYQEKKIIQCIDSDEITNAENSYDQGNFNVKGSIKVIYNDGTEEVLVDHCTQPYEMGQGVTDYICGYTTIDGKKEPHYWKLTKTDCFCKDGACIEGPVCSDSDGRDYYKQGKVSGLKTTDFNSKYEFEDNCLDNTQLQEYYCDGNYHSTKTYNCPFGCINGACLPYSPTQDEEEKEEIPSAEGCPQKECIEKSETCIGTDKLIIEECIVYIKKDGQCEKFSTSNSRMLKGECAKETKEIVCTGCQIGSNSCIPVGTRLEENNKFYYCDIQNELSLQKEDDKACQNNYECKSNNCFNSICKPICDGCLDSSNTCIPFGTRTETQYCDIDYSFKNQKSEDMNCNNNYECSTNVCIDSKCISQNLIQKFILWFKKLFGG